MEMLAKELRKDIDMICIGYHYDRQTNVVEKGGKLSEKIQQFASVFLQGNVFGIGEDEYNGLKAYTLQVLEDYVQALEQRDMVLMIDTLDYGLRELLYIFIDKDGGDENDE